VDLLGQDVIPEKSQSAQESQQPQSRKEDASELKKILKARFP
jgi:hypothetical protein